MQGTGDDEGRYFRCWNCGFRCDTRRDRLGDKMSVSGNAVEECLTVNHLGSRMDGDHRSGVIVMDFLNVNNQALLGPGGVKHDMKPIVGSGCPHCGTPNWRGDY